MPPQERRWTVEEFHKILDLGYLEGRRVQLLHGVLIEEGSMSVAHAIAATKVEGLIRDQFKDGHHVRVTKPLVLNVITDPEPDVAVVVGKPGDYTSHPTTAALVIEVADSSLNHDLTVKAELYATANIADYWVLDVDGRRLLVFRDPAPVPGGTAAYRTHLVFSDADTVPPLAAPASTVRVADLLP
jgi:Uma2 family endonuclease